MSPLINMTKKTLLIIFLMNLDNNAQLYQIFSLELTKQLIYVLIVKIFIMKKNYVNLYVITMKYLIL